MIQGYLRYFVLRRSTERLTAGYGFSINGGCASSESRFGNQSVETFVSCGFGRSEFWDVVIRSMIFPRDLAGSYVRQGEAIFRAGRLG